MLLVQKYGGTSLGNAERMLSVAKIIIDTNKKHKVIAVVSAMSSYIKAEGTTSKLLFASDAALTRGDFHTPLQEIKKLHLDTINGVIRDKNIQTDVKSYVENTLKELENFLWAIQIIGEISARSHDVIISAGEKLSAKLLSGVIKDQGVKSEYIDLSDIGPENQKEVNSAYFTMIEENLKKLLTPKLEEKSIPVITGYMGPIPGGIIAAIGRGYTDFTAALVSAGLQADELQIWKEVDGIFTANPNLVKNASVLATITPKEAAELTYFGSEVIHPFTMERVIRKNIPIRILNTFKPELEGTLVTAADETKWIVKSVTAKKNISVVNVMSNRMLMAYGFVARVFHVFEKYQTVIDLISTSEVNISMTVDKTNNLDKIIKEMENFGNVEVQPERAIVSIVGRRMVNQVGIAARMFSALASEGINIELISQGASEINVSCVIANKDADKAIMALHKEFIEK